MNTILKNHIEKSLPAGGRIAAGCEDIALISFAPTYASDSDERILSVNRYYWIADGKLGDDTRKEVVPIELLKKLNGEIARRNQDICGQLVGKYIGPNLCSTIRFIAENPEGDHGVDDVYSLYGTDDWETPAREAITEKISELEDEIGIAQDSIDECREDIASHVRKIEDAKSASADPNIDLNHKVIAEQIEGSESAMEDLENDIDSLNDEIDSYRSEIEELNVDDWDDDQFREYCDDEGIDPEQREVFEHWHVDSWFAGKLQEQGQQVIDVLDFNVWCRGTTGQAILLDGCIHGIAQDMEILVGQPSQW